MGNACSKAAETDEENTNKGGDDNVIARLARRRDTPSHPMQALWIARGMPFHRPEFTATHKRIVSESWVYLKGSMFQIGKAMFREMFNKVPAIRYVFTKQNDVPESFVIKYHVEKVMVTVDRLVHYIDNSEQVELFCQELGDRHAEHTVKIEYLDLFTPFFITAIHPALNARWASSIEDAWAAFFKYVLHILKENIVF